MTTSVSTPRARLAIASGTLATSPAIVVAFTGAIFLNAFLLFWVEPMFGKMVLPLLGGTAAVWNTCMLFFQVMLLAGYIYAHLSARWLRPRVQAALHVVLLLLACTTLPIAVASGWAPPTGEAPVPWLIALLTVSIGAPFVLLSAGTPLLQHWFVRTPHPSARNPYFLYAASNAGSLLALLSYPLLLEPNLRLAEQSRVWAASYGLLLVVLIGCATVVWKLAPGTRRALDAVRLSETADVDRLTAGIRIRWLVLAFAPSSLLLGVTTYLTTDVAAIPLLWVIPLSLYLLTFVIAFAAQPSVAGLALGPAAWAHTVLLLPLLLQFLWNLKIPGWAPLIVHVAAFVAAALVCHGELSRTRPGARHLTEFYLWMSVGGALGGAFNVLVAPAIFRTVLEYPIAIALVCFVRPAVARPRGSRGLRMGILMAVGAVLTVAAALRQRPGGVTPSIAFALFGALSVLLVSLRAWPLAFGLSVAATLAVGARPQRGAAAEYTARSFFGVSRVWADSARGARVLLHGVTVHGAQSFDPAYRRTALTYYSPGGPLGDVFRARPPGAGRRIAVVGLGAGAIAAYAAPGDAWTYYEIDPVVVRIAQDRRYFTYLTDSPAPVRVVLGDARLSLRTASDGEYDVIVLDAFSSDAIPLHLLTREALRLYMSKLAPRGIIALHVSNNYLNLEPAVARLARDAALSARIRVDQARAAPGSRATLQRQPSAWVALGRNPADLRDLTSTEHWRALSEDASVRLWTDDYSNILSVLGRVR
jgi:spermidine synthase